MTSMVFVALASVVMSTHWVSGTDFFAQLSFLRVEAFCDDSTLECAVDVLTKYILFFSLAGVAIGFMFFVGALGVKVNLSNLEKKNGEH